MQRAAPAFPMTSLLGHNQPSFDQVVEESLLRGLYFTQLDALVAAMRDPHLRQRHRLVLAELIERTNAKTGTAFPGRAKLAADIVYYDAGIEAHYTQATIAKTISELLDWGYVMADRRAPVGGGRALAHYTITKPSTEELQIRITEALAELRKSDYRGPDEYIGGNVSAPVSCSDGDTGVSVRGRDGDTGGNVDTSGNVTTGVRQYRKKEDSTALVGAGPPAAPRKRDAKPRTRLPKDWTPAPETVAWAKTNYVTTDQQIAREAERFRDHHVSKGNAMADWPAAWRTWWGNGFHKIPRRLSAAPDMRIAPSGSDDRELREAFERARQADEEATRCDP